jgi:uncharacterized protein YndB with AHSA1/START domain
MTPSTLDELVLDIEQTLEIKAAPGDVYEGLLRRLCNLEGEEGQPGVKLELERWPGGRWFRDLGNGAGHLWGVVQSIKPPTLIEFHGPLMMSAPVVGHLIVRLAPITGGTKVSFRNRVLGPIPAEFREGVREGWGDMLQSLKKDFEK